MFMVPFNYIVVYIFIALGLVLIAARYLMLGIAGLLLLLIPVEVILRFIL